MLETIFWTTDEVVAASNLKDVLRHEIIYPVLPQCK